MGRQKMIFVCLGLLVCFNLAAWSAVFRIASAAPLKVVFFDIGQGDAAFIEIAGLYQILIDGGPGKKVLEKLTQEMGFWDKSIDLVILTHPEKDHLEGLISVLEQYEVSNVLWTGVERETAVFEAWLEALAKEKQEGAQIKIAEAGQHINLARTDLAILYPFESLEGTKPKDSNKTSIVAKLNFGQTDFLFTGDIYDDQEKEMIEKGEDLEASVLKLAHHASKTSTSEIFLQTVLSQIAIASVGQDNSYGHPHQEVLARLEKYGIQLLRTDENGDITMESNGSSLIIK